MDFLRLNNLVMYFKKLNLAFPNIDYEKNISHYLMSYGNKKLLTYYRLNDYVYTEILKCIPDELKSHVTSIDWVISGTESPSIVPHTDNGIICNINYYLETANAMTSFYEPKSSGIPTPIVDEQGTYGNLGGTVFGWNDVTLKTLFIAKNNECYLLDVSKVHAVTRLAVPNQRKFVTVMFEKLDFDTVSRYLS